MQFNKDEIKQAASGCWDSILVDMCGVDDGIFDGQHHSCPKCGGSDRFRVIDEKCGGLFCNQCFNHENGDGIAAVQWLLDCSFTDALKLLAEHLGIEGSEKPESVNPLDMMSRQKRVPAEALRQYGARVVGPCVEFPVYDNGGFRCSTYIVNPTGSAKMRKGIFAKDMPAGLFFPTYGKTVRLPMHGDTWLVVEGVKDAAALYSLGYINSCGLNRNEMSSKFVRLFHQVRVIVIPDRDLPGTSGGEATAARLWKTAKSVDVAHLPVEIVEKEGKDVRDVLAMSGGEGLVRSAITNAREWMLMRKPDEKPAVKPECPAVDRLVAACRERKNWPADLPKPVLRPDGREEVRL